MITTPVGCVLIISAVKQQPRWALHDLQAESAGPSSTAVQPPRVKAQEAEQEEDSEPEGSQVSYGSDQPPGQSDADSDGKHLISAGTEQQSKC